VDLIPGHEFQVDDSNNRLGATRVALATNLDFHGTDGRYGPHAWHPFPAKFPPQLPEFIIKQLSDPDDIVLDPMFGSGTTLVEAVRLGRRAVGCDIDPLARMIAEAKLGFIDPIDAFQEGNSVLADANDDYHHSRRSLERDLKLRFDPKTEEFVNYWFLPQQQLELLALIQRIEELPKGGTRNFLQVVFSSTIIAKSGGVSLARDLAHTRPHRDPEKMPMSAFAAFGRNLERNVATFDKDKVRDTIMPLRLDGFSEARKSAQFATIQPTSAADTGLPAASVDLIMTSPPYANNAIDYMRAHKFSLVWFGWKIADLSRIRAKYVGHDAISGLRGEGLPSQCEETLIKLAERDERKSLVLRRYFEEMLAIIWEMRRVLKRGRPAVIVIGSSNLRGLDVETHKGIAAIGEKIGFALAEIGIRQLDRDKRMMPARWGRLRQSQIEERMHEEYVIGLVKP